MNHAMLPYIYQQAFRPRNLTRSLKLNEVAPLRVSVGTHAVVTKIIPSFTQSLRENHNNIFRCVSAFFFVSSL